MGVWSRVHGSERLLTPSNSRFRCGGIGGSDSPIRRMLPCHQAMAPVDYANSPSNDWWQWMAVSVTIDKATHYVPAPFAVRLLQRPQKREALILREAQPGDGAWNRSDQPVRHWSLEFQPINWLQLLRDVV